MTNTQYLIPNTPSPFLAALRGERPNPVPVACWLGLPLLLQLTPGATTYADLYRLWCDDPLTIVAVQERLGLDPLVLTHTEHPGEVITLPRLSYSTSALSVHSEK
jgi:hypothetical protein